MARSLSLAAVLVALPVIWLAAGAALAAGDVATRAANHEGFGRIVFDWPES